MSKLVTFTDNDEALIAKIKEYQKAHGLSSFVAAVRKLCSDALEIAKISHNCLVLLASLETSNVMIVSPACACSKREDN